MLKGDDPINISYFAGFETLTVVKNMLAIVDTRITLQPNNRSE